MDEEQYRLPPERVREIYLITFFAINLILVLGTYGVCGKVGKAVSGFFFGIFGGAFYILPFFFCVAACLIVANMDKQKSLRRAIIKILWWFAVFMVLGFIFQLSAGLTDHTVKTLYMDGYSSHKGGGIVFGGIIVLASKAVGKVGAIIITVLVTIIAIIELTEKSVINQLKRLFTFSYADIAKERSKYGTSRSYDDYDDDDYDDYDEYDGYSDNYDAYDIDDEELERLDRLSQKIERDKEAIRQRSRFDDQKVLPSEERPKEKKKRGRKKSTNKVVREEEMRELVPGGTTDEYPIALPGEQVVRDTTLTGAAPKSSSKKNASKNHSADDEGPVDFFNIQPSQETYDDPFGSNTFYDAVNSRVVEKDEIPVPTKEELANTRTASDSYYSRAGISTSGRRGSYHDDTEELKPSYHDDTEELRPSYHDDTEELRPSYHANTEEIKQSHKDDITSERPSYSAAELDFEPKTTEDKVSKDDKLKATDEVKNEIAQKQVNKPKKKYVFPPMKLLKSGGTASYFKNDGSVRETAKRLKETLASFGVNVTITDYSCGPAVTRYELQPEQGVKVSRILSLADDIKLNLAAADIRIEAPIPGKAAVGIEVPNKDNQMVYFRDIIDNDSFKKYKSNVAFAVGKDIGGQIVITDIAKMPHLLIAGATGSGKSVCINTIIMSILYKAAPEDVRMIMIDPKMVELAAYNGIPHLLIPVVTDPKKAAGALNWAVEEMTKRYQLFAKYGVRNIQGFNQKVEQEAGAENDDPAFTHMPLIVVIVDELADLMMVAHGEVEDSIVRLTQLARAAGIHLVIATQRPSVDVITGLIKANVPSRIAFAVSSGVDSKTILDMVGAEKLLGKGDMLFYPTGSTKPSRVQGAFISDEEVASVTSYIKEHFGDSEYDATISESINSSSAQSSSGAGASDDGEAERYDELFESAGRMVIEKDKASIGYLQRNFRIGFNRAARIMDQLCEAGVVGPEEGTKPRKILMTIDEFEELVNL